MPTMLVSRDSTPRPTPIPSLTPGPSNHPSPFRPTRRHVDCACRVTMDRGNSASGTSMSGFAGSPASGTAARLPGVVEESGNPSERELGPSPGAGDDRELNYDGA
jgi:hypothetical protein